ncbi:FliM/FliN family flagellar motor switch protein [Tropicibacter sp. R16_0]|uniref:FliM/FliN family flagellar motor C-terminal domain-containing protein n=1 Tax=Tropicibacter sp. R16_0 TaxID=2821102 RepID=UPI001ADBAB98|nr:FliM/FliN family flagellar motor C-terminal domain-containing protein [Tropicibacter sp. R16_0]MBO9449178.1 FliM/FliN family flagellar motor switch protein [Tropicibacter sp. R16_0]
MPPEADTDSVIQRKLAVARDEGQGAPRSILRAMRLGLARAAADTLDLSMTVIGATQCRRSQDGLQDTVPQDRLYVLLSGPDGLLGGACFDRVCVTSVIQQQTMGTVFAVSSSERAFTGTDAAMIAPLIDAFFPRAKDLSEATVDRLCLDGYQFAARADDRRNLILSMEYDSFRLFDLTVEIGGGVAQGQITLILPDQPEPKEAAPDGLAEMSGLEKSFGVMRAELTAVISRVQLPLAAFAGMQPGDLLPLIGDKLDKTEVLTIEGQRIAVARLGQCRGMRALRLNERLSELEPPNPDAGFSEHGTPDATALTLVDPDIIEHASSVEIAADTLDNGPIEAVPPVAEAEQNFSHLSPEQAVAEISELAGLPAGSDELDPSS